MNIFFRRHLALFCAIFAAASICGCFVVSEVKIKILIIASTLISVIALLFIFIKRKRPEIFKLGLCVVFFAFAILLSYSAIDAVTEKAVSIFENSSEITAVVESVNYESDYASSYEVKILYVGESKRSQKAVLDLEYSAALSVGELISLKGTLQKIDDVAETPQYYKSKGILLSISAVPNSIEIKGQSNSLGLKIKMLNQKLSYMICENIEGESGNLISALILGNKELLSPETQRNFRRAGISHVIAISGMHLSILIMLFDFVLKKLQLGKGIRGAVVLAVAFFYLALTGFSLSTVRAFVMTAMMYLAYYFREDGDMLTNLFFALFFILAVSPLSVYDIGLWLSFLAVLGIFVAGYFIKLFSDMIYSKVKPKSKYAKRMPPKLGKLLIALFSSVVITISANVFICVPAWLYFDEISLISVIANLVVSPFVSFLLTVTPIYILLSGIGFLSGILVWTLKIICDLLLQIIAYMTSFESITVSLKHSFTAPIVVFVAISLSLCLILKFKRKWIVALPPLVAAIAFAIGLNFYAQYHSQVINFEFIGAKESEMLLLQDGGDHIVIDISSGAYEYSNDAYQRTVENTATEISAYILTHYHTNHQSTLYKLFRKAVVQTLYLPYPQDLEEYYKMSPLVALAKSANVDVVLYDSDKATSISDSVKITLSPREYLKRSTHPLLYLTIDTPKCKITYLGESSSDNTTYSNQLSGSVANSRIIILGTHGPKTKNPIDLGNLNTVKEIVFADKDIEAHFINNVRETVTFYRNTAHVKFTIPKK